MPGDETTTAQPLSVEERLARLEEAVAALTKHAKWAEEAVQKAAPLLSKAVASQGAARATLVEVTKLASRSAQHDRLIAEDHRALSLMSWQLQEMRLHYSLLTNPSPPEPGETKYRLTHVNGRKLEIVRSVRVLEGETHE